DPGAREPRRTRRAAGSLGGGVGSFPGAGGGMSGDVRVIWDEELTSYDFGPGHPLRLIRLDLTIDLARRLGVMERSGVSVGAPVWADDDLLQLVHDPA